MFGTGVCYHPDSDLGVEDRKIGKNLAEVLVVGLFELVLDNDATSVFVFREKVGTEVPSALLPLGRREVYTDHLAEGIDVFLQPRREVVSLVLEDIPSRETMKVSDRIV